MRTTMDIEQPILSELKTLARRRRRSMGEVASELLAEALKQAVAEPAPAAPFHWHGKEMRAKVDLKDREAVYAAMDKLGTPK